MDYTLFDDDGKEWQKQKLKISERYIWDSSMTIDQSGRIYVLTAANQSDFHWRDASNEIYLFTGVPNVDSDYKFSTRKIIPKKEGLSCWLPNLEENQNHVLFDEKDFFILNKKLLFWKIFQFGNFREK